MQVESWESEKNANPNSHLSSPVPGGETAGFLEFIHPNDTGNLLSRMIRSTSLNPPGDLRECAGIIAEVLKARGSSGGEGRGKTGSGRVAPTPPILIATERSHRFASDRGRRPGAHKANERAALEKAGQAARVCALGAVKPTGEKHFHPRAPEGTESFFFKAS